MTSEHQQYKTKTGENENESKHKNTHTYAQTKGDRIAVQTYTN